MKNSKKQESEQWITKREYFAAMAMQGILANSKLCSPKNFDRSCMCDDAITMADELLKQLSNDTTSRI